jgi:hypothetical protein
MAATNTDSDLSIAAPSYNADSDLSIAANDNSIIKPQNNRLSSNNFSKGSDILRDMIYGFGKSSANIAKLIYKNAPDMPDIRSKNSNSLAVGLGQYAPFAIGGGASLLGSTVGAGTFGATQYEPGQKGFIDTKLGIPTNRTTNSIEDAVINAITHGLLPFGKNKPVNVPVEQNSMNINFKPNEAAPFKQQASFPSIESEFSKVPIKLPEFLKEQPPTPLSENISKELHENITGGKDFEQAGKELSQDIKNSYENEVYKHQERYKNIFEFPTENESIATGEPLKVKEIPMYGKDYLENYRDYEFPDKDVQKLHDKYLDNPNIENAHKLQSELGSEIGYMKKQNSNGTLDQSGKNKLKDYVIAQKSLKNSMNSTLNDINPEIAKEYKNVTESWKNNVIPFHSDKDLKSIAEGKTKNPTTAQIISIFKNPEENISSVISKLPEEAKDKIVHIGMGKDIYQNAPKDLLAAEKSLRTKGLSSYVAPQHEQMFRNLRNNVEVEKNSQAQFERNQKMSESLQKAQQEAQQKSLAYNKQSQKTQESARSESNKMAEEKIRELEKQHNDKIKELKQKETDLIKEKQETRKKRIAAIKYAIGGSAAYGALHAMGLSPEQLIAFYLGKNLNKNSKK